MTQYLTGTLLWTGALLAYVWKKRGRSGWAGFGLGLLIAATFFMVSSFSVTAWRNYEKPRADDFLDSGAVPNATSAPGPFGKDDSPVLFPEGVPSAASVPGHLPFEEKR